MREFSTSISQALANGLMPDESFRDTMFFEDLYNLIPAEMRLRSYQEVTDILPISQEDRQLYYPFPQWFRLEGDNLLVTKDSLYEVQEYPNPPFDLKSLLLDMPELSETLRVADYKDSWILLNREGCLYKLEDQVRFTKQLRASSLLNHQNRTLIGGALDGFWTDGFMSELDKVVSLAELERSGFDLELGKNFVFWSDYDSAFFPLSLLEPELAFNSFMQDSNFTELLYSNQFGYIEMPFSGAILDIVESNQQVFVFGEDGICSLAVNTQSTGSGYHITGSQPFGIKQRGAVAGDDASLVFIDVFDQLWYVTGQGLEKLDYSKYMSQLGNNIWITKDPEEELFYIGDSNKSFILSEGKLSRCFQTVMATNGAYPFRAGVVLETGDKKARLKSQGLDLGNTDKKTLTGVAVGTDKQAQGNVKASVELDDGRRVDTPKVALNPEGYGATRIHGSNHKIEIELNDYKNLNVDHIELKWQIDDRRQRRGTFTTQDSSGAG